MSVVCTVCKTENRDHAMFCRGCARKLPAFAANGPAVFDIMKSLRLAPAADPWVTQAAPRGMLALESRAFWLRLGLLALAITVGFVGWYAYVTRRASPPAVPAAAVVRSVPPVTAAPAVFPPPVMPAPARVPAAEALAAGETLAPAGAAAPPPVPADVFGSRDGAERRESAPRRRDPPAAPVGAPVRAAAADPRPGCAHLNFIAAARCEAAQCRRAEYRTHPHCDAVREQTRRDIARRDLAF